jgi:NAD(P)-dependent dehydrogenase (short-subunit alcohol dehydrogenase family)
LTADLKARRIRVNAISPGPIDTPILGMTGLTDEQIEDFKSGITSQVPLGRIGLSEEIAKPALFLASDDSSYISGIELTVDGSMGKVEKYAAGGRHRLESAMPLIALALRLAKPKENEQRGAQTR